MQRLHEANLKPAMYTVGAAAKASGFSKATISRAIKSGQMSAKRQDDQSYAIDPSELQRWIDSNSHRNTSVKRIATLQETPVTPPEEGALQAEIAGLRQLADERQRTIDDLRTRLDTEGEERRKLTAMLTDQRTKPKGFWSRLLGN